MSPRPVKSVTQGSVGGSSDDAGVEYRRGVAAYAVAYGLAGLALPGLEIPEADANVCAVALETDAPVDDIRLSFSTGWIADVQAKRALRRGRVFEKVAAQWIEAGRAGVDPSCHRLVVATGRMSGPMEALKRVLDRRRLHGPGTPTQQEREMLDYVEGLLAPLTPEQRGQVLDCAVIWEVAVEEPEHVGAREAVTLLAAAGITIAEGSTRAAWETLRDTAGRLARRRGGHDIAGWLNALRAVGLVVETIRDNPAGAHERSRGAVARYAERLVRESRHLDLRALGAELPPLVLDNADAGVTVGLRSDDDRHSRDLTWALLRRRRVVLTGLPGSGKSTALRKASGYLAARHLEELQSTQSGDPAYPFPVRASLKQINVGGQGSSFRDRMLGAALRDESAADRELVRVEVERRLDRGLPIALFLDALDETYDDRAHVVADLEAFLASVPDSVCVLVATRDIAYGQAATLGWEDLRLLPPRRVDTVIDAVLGAAAEHRNVPARERDLWIDDRRTWINQILNRDDALVETPLIPVLLALLAIERPPQRLPTRRAEVLQGVMVDVMERHEAPRHGDRPLRNLTGTDIGTASMHGYATEAATILDSGGIARIDETVSAVAETMREMWGMPPAPASAAARDAIRFLDETGIFVTSEPDGTVTARLALFAEIGDAIYAMQRPLLASDWVSRRIESRQLDAIALAAALDESINGIWQDEFSARKDDLDLARVVARAGREGTELTSATVELLRESFVTSLERGTSDAWSDWKRLVDLGIPAGLADRVVAAAAKHSSSHGLLARAVVALGAPHRDAPGYADADLLELLRHRNLPHSANDPGGADVRFFLTVDRTLVAAQEAAARALLSRNIPGAVDVVRERALDAPDSLRESLLTLLRAHGHSDVAAAIQEEAASRLGRNLADLPKMFEGLDEYPRFLTVLADAPRAELSTSQRVELSELGDFLETLDMNDTGARVLYGCEQTFLEALIGLTCSLFGFHRDVLAGEAQVVLDRLAADQSHEVYFSLFDGAVARTRTDWSVVEDPIGAVDLLIGMFFMSRSQAGVATKCLWSSEVASEHAGPRLRRELPRLDRYPRHQVLMAFALASLPGVPEPQVWVSSDNPALREVAAAMCTPVVDGAVAPVLEVLLADADGNVRDAAVRNLSRSAAADLETRLEVLAAQPEPGWRCAHCLNDNPPEATSCRGEGCRLVGPRPAQRARELLEERRALRGTAP